MASERVDTPLNGIWSPAEGRPRGTGFRQMTMFDPADFVIRSDGVCRLNPEMARIVVTTVST
jgi:hypothetical protein